MTYTGNSPILGVGKSSPAQIDRFFELRGKSLAPNYAPDGQYVPAPAGIGQLIIAAARTWPQSVNHDLLASQVLKESAAWQSEYARHRFNPSGMGAVNHDPDQAIRFDSPLAGLKATVAHLLTYIGGPGSWTEYDPRAAVTPAQWQGTVRKLSDLDGKWAYPGKDYGASIANIANELLKVEVPPVSTFPKPSMIPYPSPNHDGYNVPRRVEAIVYHIATGTKASNLAWLTNPKSQASCNAYIDKQGQIYEMVDYDSAPWTNGPMHKPDLSNPVIKRWHDNGLNPNPYCYTIEHEGNPEDDLTEAQIKATQRVTAWVASKAGIPISRVHIIGHYQIDSVNRAHCPSFNDAEWTRLIAGAKALLDGATPPADPAKPPKAKPEPNGEQNPWGRFWVPEVFLADIAKHDWYVTGWAVSGAFGHEGRVIQYFERARLELNADGSVSRGLVGREAFVSQHPGKVD